jgi:hypothetical protein
MKLSVIVSGRWVLSLASFGFAALVGLAPAVARADSPATPVESPPSGVSVVAGQFGDHVDQGRATGDGAAIFAAKKAVYWVDIANAGDATAVTLVWTLDGHEVQRQSLDVGHSGHWHTWGSRPLGNAKKVDVEVLDASGRSLKTDSLSDAS